MLVALDSNILLRFLHPADRHYPHVHAALDALDAHHHTPCTFTQNVGEFWNVSTRPSAARGGYGLDLAVVKARLEVIERRIKFLFDDPDIYLIWRQLLFTHAVKGVQVHDARIAAAMKFHSVTHILTLNADDFRRYPAVTAWDPANPPAAWA